MPEIIRENKVIAGNIYNKYETRNIIAKYLMKGFLVAFDCLVSISGAFKVYEVGCGEGNLSIRLAKQNKIVRASDFSEWILNRARENAKEANVDIEFKVRSIYDMHQQEDSSELIICAEVLEHLEKTEQALEVLSKLPDPYIIISVPREPIWRILNILRGKYLLSLGNTPGHLCHWSKKSFLKTLEPYFDVVKVLTPLP